MCEYCKISHDSPKVVQKECLDLTLASLALEMFCKPGFVNSDLVLNVPFIVNM